MCLHSLPRAGRVILLKVIGHFKETLTAVCSTPSSLDPFRELFIPPVTLLKFNFILLMQCSAGSKRFRRRPCRTERTLGRCTNCNTNKCDWKRKKDAFQSIKGMWQLQPKIMAIYKSAYLNHRGLSCEHPGLFDSTQGLTTHWTDVRPKSIRRVRTHFSSRNKP